MKKKIIYGLLLAVAMVTASSSFVSCKDYEGDDYAHWQEKNASLEQALADQQAALANYLLKKDYKAIEDTAALHNWILGLQTRLDNIKAGLQPTDTVWLHNAIVNLQTAYNNLIKVTGTDTARWNAYQTEINKINNTLDNLIKVTKEDTIRWNEAAALAHENNKLILSLSDTLTHFILMWGDNLTDAYANAAKAASIAKSYDNDTAAINRAVEKAQEVADSALAIADSAWNYVNKGMAVDRDGNTKKDLQAWVKYFEAADDALQEQIDALKQDIENILGTLKKQITGVIIQSTYNPVFGSASLPFGIQSNVLAAYVGKNDLGHDVIFPSYAAEDYVSGKTVISQDDYTYLTSKGLWPAEVTLADGENIMTKENNAGKLYVTVNPTNIDFNGTEFSLVNSRNEEAPVELSALKPSERLITWGWTRAAQQIADASPNGFYEAVANIPEDKIDDVKIRVDKSKIAASVKNAWKNKSVASISDFAKIIYNTMEDNTSHQAYGMKAEWTDTFGIRSYVSKYEIAAAAISPLSFNSASILPTSIKRQWIPTFDKQFVADELKLPNLNFEFKVDATNKVYVEIPEMYLDPNMKEVYVDADGNTLAEYNGYLVYYDKDWGGYWELQGIEFRSGYALIDVTPMLEKVYGKLTDEFVQLNTLPTTYNANIDKFVADLNSYLNKINNYIVSFNSRINGLANSLLNGAHAMMQPALFFQGKNGMGQLSANHEVVTSFSLAGLSEGEILLIPSSYNFDLITPAYKKSVIVTNVYNKAMTKSAQINGGDLENALKAVNGELKSNELLSADGGMPTVKFKATSAYKDMVFEIAYTAVDYTGHIAGRKFYLTVVE